MASKIIVPLGKAIDGPDIESSHNACCRICLEDDNTTGNELISPCFCKGTQQFVHRSCLDHWRSVKEGFAFSHCTTCKAQYHFRVVLTESNSWRKTKFQFFVARDLLLVFVTIQLIITTIGSLSYLLDRYGSFRNFYSDGWLSELSKHPIPFYYCLGVLVFLVMFGVVGLIMQCGSMLSDQQMANNQHVVRPNEPSQFGYSSMSMDAPEVCSSTFSRDQRIVPNQSEVRGTSCWYCSGSDCSACSGSDCSACSECGKSGSECCLAIAIVLIIIFAILGIFYGVFAATVTFQRICQRHYHILKKKGADKGICCEGPSWELFASSYCT